VAHNRPACGWGDSTRPAACDRRRAQPGERSEAAQRPQLNSHGLSPRTVSVCCVCQFHTRTVSGTLATTGNSDTDRQRAMPLAGAKFVTVWSVR